MGLRQLEMHARDASVCATVKHRALASCSAAAAHAPAAAAAPRDRCVHVRVQQHRRLAGCSSYARSMMQRVGVWHAARVRSFAIGAAAHAALLLLAVLYMPLTADAAPWLEPGAPASPSLLHMAFRGQIAGEAHWICKLLLSMAVPLLLSPLRLWTRFYSGACVLLAMYAMNSDGWRRSGGG